MSSLSATGSRHFHDQLASLKERLVEMAELAEDQLGSAMESLRILDANAAAAVVARDDELDRMELEIEQMSVELIATQQPMARDLRFLVAIVKITSDLERIGDHAVNIAQSVTRLKQLPLISVPMLHMTEMSQSASKMLADSIDAFIRADGNLARDVCLRDDRVDALHESLFRAQLTHMMSDPRTINSSLEVMLVSRNLERVADLATNISEDAVYLAEGRQIRHEEQKVRAPEPPESSLRY